MVGWHHRLNRHEFEQAPGNGEGRGSLVFCSPWGHKESDATEWLRNNNNVRFEQIIMGICFYNNNVFYFWRYAWLAHLWQFPLFLAQSTAVLHRGDFIIPPGSGTWEKLRCTFWRNSGLKHQIPSLPFSPISWFGSWWLRKVSGFGDVSPRGPTSHSEQLCHLPLKLCRSQSPVFLGP